MSKMFQHNAKKRISQQMLDHHYNTSTNLGPYVNCLVIDVPYKHKLLLYEAKTL
jgi:hypothetical protein